MIRIEIDDDRRAFAPFEEITGAIIWRIEPPPDAIEVRLGWYTSGRGTGEAGIADSVQIDRPHFDGRQSFRFVAPAGR